MRATIRTLSQHKLTTLPLARRMIDVNLRSQFYTIQAFMPNMIEKGEGHIVATSSAMGYVGVAQMSESSAERCYPCRLMLTPRLCSRLCSFQARRRRSDGVTALRA